MQRILFLIVFALGQSAQAQTGPFALTEDPLISVFGAAKIEVVPDYALIGFYVFNVEKKVLDAKEKTDRVFSNVLRTIERFDIDRADVVFDGVEIEEEYDYDRYENSKLVGVGVGRHGEVRLRNFALYEAFVGALLEDGVGLIERPIGGVDDLTAAEVAVLEQATDDARRKAQGVARRLNMSLGALYELVDNGRATVSPRFRQRIVSRDAYDALVQVVEEVNVVGSRIKPGPERIPPLVLDNVEVSITIRAVFRAKSVAPPAEP